MVIMETRLFNRINQLIILSTSQQADLSRRVVRETLTRGTVLLEQGQVCDHIYFVETGVLRSYCVVDDKDVTRWFSFSTHFATDYFSFVYQKPSENTIVTVTDVDLLSLSYLALQDLCHKDAVWIDLNRRLLEEYYLSTQDRVMSFQTQSTAERYQQILTEFPEIENQVALGHLASFLGMSQENLSRLRHQRRQKMERQGSH